jgi:tRNA dimethylallyltransferase
MTEWQGWSYRCCTLGLFPELIQKRRFRTLIFWVYDPPDVLNERLDRRVDGMIEVRLGIAPASTMIGTGCLRQIKQKGLIDEIIGLRGQAELIYGAEDRASHEEGIFQSIGYKEFTSIPTSELSPAHPLFKPAVERMKLSTRQYAKKQLKWIKKQLLPAVQKAKSQGGEVYIYVLKAGETKHGRELLEGLSFARRAKSNSPSNTLISSSVQSARYDAGA